MIHIIHAQVLTTKQEIAEKIKAAGPSMQISDTLWLLDVEEIPKDLKTVLRDAPGVFFITKMHSYASWSGRLSTEQSNWIMKHSPKKP